MTNQPSPNPHGVRVRYIVQAMLRGGRFPNPIPYASLETQSITLADTVAALFRREGFKVERFIREDGAMPGA